MHCRVMPDGSVRRLWSDDEAESLRGSGAVPRRAGLIVGIPEGPRAGFFHVDFSPMVIVAEDDRWNFCLTRTFPTHREAHTVEEAYLLENWIYDGIENKARCPALPTGSGPPGP